LARTILQIVPGFCARNPSPRTALDVAAALRQARWPGALVAAEEGPARCGTHGIGRRNGFPSSMPPSIPFRTQKERPPLPPNALIASERIDIVQRAKRRRELGIASLGGGADRGCGSSPRCSTLPARLRGLRGLMWAARARAGGGLGDHPFELLAAAPLLAPFINIPPPPKRHITIISAQQSDIAAFDPVAVDAARGRDLCAKAWPNSGRRRRILLVPGTPSRLGMGNSFLARCRAK